LAAQTFPPATDRQQANALFSRYLFMAESGKTHDDLGPENIPLAAGLGRHDALEFARALRNRLYGTLH
jgi:hypothetical protein